MSLFQFGIFADLQYGNFDAHIKRGKTDAAAVTRFYKNSLDVLNRAVDVWSTSNVRFVIQLGDLLDGLNASQYNSSTSALQNILSVFQNKLSSTPLFHVIGNHELYNFSRKDIPTIFSIPKVMSCSTYSLQHSLAYSFRPSDKFIFIIVDNYELSMLGSPSNEIHHQATEFLTSCTPNRQNYNSPEGLCNEHKHFCNYNGTISTDQANWLNSLLDYADDNGLLAVIAGHQPVEPGACDFGGLDWRYKDFLSIIRRHPSVVAYFAGHDHDGGYCYDEAKIHHITFQGVIETPPKTDCFATVEVFNDRLEIIGYGRVPSRTCFFRGT